MTTFVDTNIFVHYLVEYDAGMAERYRSLLERGAVGEEDLESSVFVLAELVWIFERPPLKLSRDAIVAHLRGLLALPGLRIPDRVLAEDAIENFSRYPRFNIVDALISAQMQRRRIDRIYSLDRDFDDAEGITRLTP